QDLTAKVSRYLQTMKPKNFHHTSSIAYFDTNQMRKALSSPYYNTYNYNQTNISHVDNHEQNITSALLPPHFNTYELDVANAFSFNDHDYDVSSYPGAYEYNNSANTLLLPYFSAYESNNSASSSYVNAHDVSNMSAELDVEVQPED
ncbi:9252_t:CDS:1, partial [Gigaspora rosea]